MFPLRPCRSALSIGLIVLVIRHFSPRRQFRSCFPFVRFRSAFPIVFFYHLFRSAVSVVRFIRPFRSTFSRSRRIKAVLFGVRRISRSFSLSAVVEARSGSRCLRSGKKLRGTLLLPDRVSTDSPYPSRMLGSGFSGLADFSGGGSGFDLIPFCRV